MINDTFISAKCTFAFKHLSGMVFGWNIARVGIEKIRFVTQRIKIISGLVSTGGLVKSM